MIPRVTTRGHYDLRTGRRLRTGYYLYPGSAFRALRGCREMSVMVHGLRNDRAAAVEKFRIAQNRLRRLGYRHPVIGYSYDSNTYGAHREQYRRRALGTGIRIAKQNGADLAQFITDFGRDSPDTRLRLLGHSLGSQVILSAIERLDRAGVYGAVEAVYLFGASIPADFMRTYGGSMSRAVRGRMINYYAPTDAVLQEAADEGMRPLGLHGSTGRAVRRYRQVRVEPADHRFRSYARTLRSFP